MRASIIALFREDVPRYISRQVARDLARRGPSAKTILDNLRLSVWDRLVPSAERALNSVSREVSRLAMQSVGVGDEDARAARAREDARAWATDRASEMVGLHRRDDGEIVLDRRPDMSIAATTAVMLHKTVSEAIEKQWPETLVRANLSEEYALSDGRAGLISNTEIGIAAGVAAALAYKASGVVIGNRWITKRDNRVEVHCRNNEAAGVLPLNKAFPSGHILPPAHPRCRCKIAPVVEQ